MKRTLILFLILALLPFAALAELMTPKEMTVEADGLAEFTIAGMPAEAYLEAAAASEGWTTVVSAREPGPLQLDLEYKYSWSEVEELLFAMSAHPIAHVEIIGESAEGRRIYSVRVGQGRKCILLTGSVHARDTIGCMYLLRQLTVLLNDYAAQDERALYLLSEFSIIAVPCVNPDGRAITEENELIDWRANSAGVDLAMNFPCSNAGQAGEGISTTFHSTEPSSSSYPGEYLGSEPETRALIGWLEEYIDQAVAFVNYDQYGRYLHTSGTYLSETTQEVSLALAEDLAEYLSAEGAVYSVVPREAELRGWSGGTVWDFAAELAEGLAFDERFGRLGLDMGEGPLPLCFYESIEEHPESYAPRSAPLACVSIDISTKGGLGYYDNARRNHIKEYDNCGYEGLLYHIMEYELTFLNSEG